jgi:hypothetical protein
MVSSADAEAAGDGVDVNVLTMEETLQNTGERGVCAGSWQHVCETVPENHLHDL